jgi:hypothetical protein
VEGTRNDSIVAEACGLVAPPYKRRRWQHSTVDGVCGLFALLDERRKRWQHNTIGRVFRLVALPDNRSSPQPPLFIWWKKEEMAVQWQESVDWILYFLWKEEMAVQWQEFVDWILYFWWMEEMAVQWQEYVD